MRRLRRQEARFAAQAKWIDRALIAAVLALLAATVVAQVLLAVDPLRAWLSEVDQREGLGVRAEHPIPAQAPGKERPLRTPE